MNVTTKRTEELAKLQEGAQPMDEDSGEDESELAELVKREKAKLKALKKEEKALRAKQSGVSGEATEQEVGKGSGKGKKRRPRPLQPQQPPPQQ